MNDSRLTARLDFERSLRKLQSRLILQRYGALAARVAESLLGKEVSVQRLRRIHPILMFLKVATASFSAKSISKKFRNPEIIQAFKVVAGCLLFFLWLALFIYVALSGY